LLLGCAYSAAGKKQQAASELSQALIAGGSYDHPLTCIALLELGKIAFEKAEFDAAGTFFLEASYSAAVFDRFDIFEESLRWASQTWLVAGKKGVFSQLAPATAWAKKKGTRSAMVTLLTCAAEHQSIFGDPQGALALVNQARTAMGRAEMQNGEVGARLNFETARVSFQTGNLKAGDVAAASALAWYKLGSRRLFQIGLADGLAVGGQITERTADLLYSTVLREPVPADWIIEPNETLASIAFPHPLPYEHWLDVCLARKEEDKALTITDMIRRHRFYSSLPLGGRLLALRWVLEAAPEAAQRKGRPAAAGLAGEVPQVCRGFQKGGGAAGRVGGRFAK